MSLVNEEGFSPFPTEKARPKVVVVDGIIGAGKTTLLEKCLLPELARRGLRVKLVEEPVEQWKESGALKQFYEDPRRRAFQFQTRAFHDRVSTMRQRWSESHQEVDLFLMERSIFTDRIFMEMLKQSGTVDATEYRDYFSLWQMWCELLPATPDLFVYLKPTLKTAMSRLRSRGREGEDGISESYQRDLQAMHDKYLDKEGFELSDLNGQVRQVPILKLASDFDLMTDTEIQQSIVEQLLGQLQL